MRYDLSVEEGLVDFIENKALPDTGVSQDNFWLGLSSLIKEMTPENRKLLRAREELQDKIDKWHVARIGQPHDHEAYKSYLKEIGYLVDEGESFLIETGPSGTSHSRPSFCSFGCTVFPSILALRKFNFSPFKKNLFAEFGLGFLRKLILE